MREYHNEVTKFDSFDRLAAFLSTRREKGPGDFETFEVELGELVRNLEADIVGEELARYNVDAEEIVVEGRTLRRVLVDEPQRYLTAAGPVSVPRSLFRENGKAKSICPLELRVGIVGGVATPRLARQVCFLMGHMTSADTAAVFDELGVSGPSASTCDRLPKVVSKSWEENRVEYEWNLRAMETVPAEAALVAVSLDGVMVPDKEGQREAKREREQAAEKGLSKKLSGPAGYREVGCGTVTLYSNDEEGKPERLVTTKYGREPEYKKATLTNQLDAELESILSVRPDLRLVALADGAEENWRYFEGPEWSRATKIVDIGHANSHLKDGLSAYYGKESVVGRAEYERLKVLLKDSAAGADEVIRELKCLRRKLPRNCVKTRKKSLSNEVRYFENQRERMAYKKYQSLGLPIGSGIVEAACKTLATQRMKQSGMSWGDGKQAILTIRSLQQSDRWPKGWRLVSQSFKKPVAILRRRGHLSIIESIDRAA